MDLPFCKICGERHRLGHCPEWDEPPPFPNKKAFLREWIDAPKTASAPQVVEHHQAQEAEKEAPQEVNAPGVSQTAPGSSAGGDGVASAPPDRPKFDRVAYQRELMRKRRAAARAK